MAPKSDDPRLAYAPFPEVPKNCVVTGSSGFVGQRVVEMLIERGAERVVAFDISPKPLDALVTPKVEYVQGDISDLDTVMGIIEGADCVWHIAAAVGPYHPHELYTKVNYVGTLNVIEACRAHGCGKLVYSSSPSTRFDGKDIDGLTEEQMPSIPQKSYLQEYAKTKALGELAVKDACCDDLLTVAIAPHQVYGPRDNLFLPNILEVAGQGMLRIFGNGKNRICFSHVDNYAHGLIIGSNALYPNSPALGKFYIVTDGDTHTDPRGCCVFWESIEEAVLYMGFDSIWAKFKLPYYLMMALATLCSIIGWIFNIRIKLNPFSVKMLTMHRWFDISAAERDLKYKPVIGFKEGWKQTCEWFKLNWLPRFKDGSNTRLAGISKSTEDKIEMSAEGVEATNKKMKKNQ